MVLNNQQTCVIIEPLLKKFSSKGGLLKWLVVSGGYTYDDPNGTRNHHHTFRQGYEYFGKVDRKDTIFKEGGSSCYPRSDNDNLATYLYKYGVEIKKEET